MRNTPTFGRSKEFAANVAYGTSDLDVQTAYAITDHIAVMLNGTILSRSYYLQDDQFRRTHFFGEAGVGYFVRSGRLAVEAFGGYGVAKVNGFEEHLFKSNFEIVHGVYDRIFFQPSLCVCEEKFSFIFTPRISAVKFRYYTKEDVYTGEQVPQPTRGVQGFFEPALTTKFRISRNFHWFMQIGVNAPMNGPYYYDGNLISTAIGIQFRTSSKDGD